MRPAAALVEQAADRELAALVDGPRTLRWFWRGELEGGMHVSVPSQVPGIVLRRHVGPRSSARRCAMASGQP